VVIAQAVVNPTTIRSRPRPPYIKIYKSVKLVASDNKIF
jgi:hypothetical protein